jgi:hypothetical protein
VQKSRKKDGEVKKSERQYQPLALQAAERLEEVQARCTQAARFVEDFKRAAAVALLNPTP